MLQFSNPLINVENLPDAKKKTTIPTEKEKKASNVLCVYGSSVTAKGLLVLKVSNRMFIQTSTRRKAKELYH